MATIWSSTKRPLYPHRAEVRSQKRRSCAKAPDENRAAAAVVAMMNVCMMGSLVRPDDSPEAFAKIAEVPATKTDGIFKACCRGRRCCFNSASAGSGGRFLGSTCRRRAQKATAAGRNRPRDPHDPISTARAPASSAGRWPCDGGAAASRHSTGTRGLFFGSRHRS
jgi:hypothetical protein